MIKMTKTTANAKSIVAAALAAVLAMGVAAPAFACEIPDPIPAPIVVDVPAPIVVDVPAPIVDIPDPIVDIPAPIPAPIVFAVDGDQAVSIAAGHFGLSVLDLDFYEATLVTDGYGPDHFDVRLSVPFSTAEYRASVNAISGDVISSEVVYF
jgi:hypothetical protein